MWIKQIENTPPAEPGFIGEGHTAVEVLTPTRLVENDPFVLLMDDRLDIAQRRVIGGAHPHAGLETVTLILEGTLTDRDEGTLSAGDAIWMTAGRGIIHNEHVEVGGRARVLQLWVRLSKAERAAAPRFEIFHREKVPVRREPGAVAKLYVREKLHVPVAVVDLSLEPASSFEQVLPADYRGFAYVLAGEVRAGGGWMRAGQVGWLEPSDSPLRFESRSEPARVVLYAGRPQREPLIHYGPFIADDERVLAGMFRDFRAGKFTRMSELSPEGEDHELRHHSAAAAQ